MQKIVYIFFILSFTSCSVLKQQNTDGKLFSEKEEYPVSIVEEIKKLNISKQSFFIRKAEIQVISGDEEESFLASVKFLLPDRYLISLRSKSGVEGARILLTGDTILINNRISRELLYGDPDYIRKKYGISSAVLPLVFGDYVFKNLEGSDNGRCVDGYMKVHSSMMGLRYESVIECNELKLISCIQRNERDADQVIMKYSRFLEIEDYKVPSRIKLEYSNFQVLITVKKIEIPWEGDFEFIPGYKYDVIPLK